MKRDLNVFDFLQAVFRFRFIACIQIQNFSGRFTFPFEYFTKASLSWQPWSEKTLPIRFVLSTRTTAFIFIFSFMVYANPATILMYLNSNDEGPGRKRPKTEFTNITRPSFFFVTLFCIEHSFIYLFTHFLFLKLFPSFVYFDILWQVATTHATGTQIVRAKMTSLDAIFCRGNKSSSRSLARFCHRKHKKSTARASALVKILCSTVGKSSAWDVMGFVTK